VDETQALKVLTFIHCQNDPPKGNDLQRARVRRQAGSLRDTLQGFVTESVIAYVPRGIGQRSLHSSPREGKPLTWQREAGVSDTKTCVMQKVEPVLGVIRKEQ